MKSMRLTLMTALLTAALGAATFDAQASDRGGPARKYASESPRHERHDPVQSLLRRMDWQIRHLEEDLERENVRRVRGYAIRLERLAEDLDETRRREGTGRGRRVWESLRRFEDRVEALRWHGEAGRLQRSRAEARRLRAQFTLLADQLGYRFR